MYECETDGVVVRVKPNFSHNHSSPDDGLYVWTYEVEIENRRSAAVQLMSRKWTIADNLGVVREVGGKGVVGEQPVIAPGDIYAYSSGAPLETPSGLMIGSYEMQTAMGENLIVDIPAFSLDSPYETARTRPN